MPGRRINDEVRAHTLRTWADEVDDTTGVLREIADGAIPNEDERPRLNRLSLMANGMRNMAAEMEA